MLICELVMQSYELKKIFYIKTEQIAYGNSCIMKGYNEELQFKLLFRSVLFS